MVIFLSFYALDVLGPYWRGSGQVPWKHFTDQSLYLRSAQAFAVLSLDPARHHYPPLYMLVAAPFVRLFPADPFVFVNVACVAGSVALLVTLFGAMIGWWLAAVCAVAFLALPSIVPETFVVPWTSTLATLLVFLAVWRLACLDPARGVLLRESFVFSAILGLIVPTRPLDAVAAASLYPFWISGLWRADAGRVAPTRMRRMAAHLGALGAGGLLGPVILFGVNLLIYRRPSSPYVRGFGSSDAYSWSTIAEKFVSLFLDSASLYVEPGQVVFRRFPWMLLGLVAVALCFALGPRWLRAAALAVALQIGLYVSFDDLLPNGMYRYFNYHYFRWAFWLAFMMIPASVVLARLRFPSRAWPALGAAVAVAVVLGCLGLSTSESQIDTRTEGGRIGVTLPAGSTDYLDFPGLTADWATAYFPGQDIWIGGRRPAFVHARFLQTATGTRLLFIRPVRGGRVELSAAQWRGGASAAFAGSHAFRLGFPAWLNERPASLPLDVPVRLDGMLSDLLFESGFAGFDGRGRPIAAREAVLALPLSVSDPRQRLFLRLAAAGPTAIALSVAGGPDQSLTVGPGEATAAIDVPIGAVSSQRMTRIRLRSGIGPNTSAQNSLAIVGVMLQKA